MTNIPKKGDMYMKCLLNVIGDEGGNKRMVTSKSYAQTYLGVIFKITLEEQGYKVSEQNRYIIAEKDNNKYLIQKTCRLLTVSGGIEESSVVCTKRNVVEKLIQEAEKLGFIPAIAFGVCKYEYRDAEIIIVPLQAWNDNNRPAYLSETPRGYFFNYKHVNEGGIDQALVHAALVIQYDIRIGKNL